MSKVIYLYSNQLSRNIITIFVKTSLVTMCLVSAIRKRLNTLIKTSYLGFTLMIRFLYSKILM